MDVQRRAWWVRSEGEEFGFDPGSGEVTSMRLVGVDLVDRDGGGSLTALFAADTPQPFTQGVYVVSHPGLGSEELMAVPSGPAELVVTFTWLDAPS